MGAAVREERAKLVFLIEALPEKPEHFRVGQPIDVKLMRPTAPAQQPEASR